MKSNNSLLKQGNGAFAGIVLSQQYGETIVREHIKRNTSNSPDQQSHRAQWGGWATSWAQLNQDEIASFTRLAAIVTAAEGRIRPLTNYQMYTRLCDVLASVNRPPLTVAPETIDHIDTMPGLTMTVTRASGSGVFSLRVIPDAAYDMACQVWACNWFAPGRNKAKKNAWRLIGNTENIPVGGAAFSTDYAARFGPVPVGQKVAISLVPVSEHGFRSNTPVMVYGLCGALSAEADAVTPDETEDAGDGASLSVVSQG